MENYPRLVYLIACDSANFARNPNGDEKVALIEPMISYESPFLPTQLSFAVAGGLDNLDPQKEYNFKLRILNPKGKEISKQAGSFQYNKPVGKIPPNTTFVIDLRNIPLEHEGEYTIHFYLDEIEVGKQSFAVYKQG